MRMIFLLTALALVAVVGAFGAAPRSVTASGCPAHPPGVCCTGAPACHCTIGSCL